MDDDYQDNSGFGSLAWYQMGRWSERSSQRTREWVDNLHNPVVAKVHYDQAVRLNQALAAENRRLNNLVDVFQTEVNGGRADYERLRIWANERLENAKAWEAHYYASKAKHDASDREKDLLISDIYRRWNETSFGPEPPDEFEL